MYSISLHGEMVCLLILEETGTTHSNIKSDTSQVPSLQMKCQHKLQPDMNEIKAVPVD